ncbi:FtsW/RodA/SpoVE family cell cycle protein [Corynebacterium lubricantis]|uniref:FtsW/RodA/SpoVE family cell cycle protein n=1 Tax=Corynebacterium lubricantis TaxID=541095 RepID=UPI00037DADCF|nr:putative peptidoglycan glycosyltransferase FtsW [Corynebacterium lubricantis]
MTTTRDRPTQQAPARSRVTQALHKATEWMNSQPLLDYSMIRTIVLVLAALGVVMVTSSSMSMSVFENDNVWAQPLRQAVMVLAGLVVFWVMLRFSPEHLQKWSMLIMGVALLLLILVLTPMGTGRETVGSQSWLPLFGVQIQPSEFAKVAIAIWGASILANKNPSRIWSWNNGYLPFCLIAGLSFILIAAQGDLGMAVSFGIVVGVLLIFAGIPWGFVWVVVGFAVLMMGFVFVSGGFRSERFHTFFDALTGNISDTQGSGYQTYQGFLSLADGSWFGVGLGQSRAKWFYLPEAKNDFIFAVIGEELGLWGGVLVIALFFGLCWFGFRAARRAQTQFQSLMAATLTAGVVSQAFINIGYVVGLLPVTGIQLPMISAGGTSAIITIGSMGILASVARHEPDAISSMQNQGRPFFDRMLAVPEPQPYVPNAGKKKKSDDKGHTGRTPHDDQTSRYGQPVTARRNSPRQRTSTVDRREAPRRSVPTASQRRQTDRPRRAPSASVDRRDRRRDRR